ncbi:LysE family transporter [Micromonospora zhanjiangensis]|uniref:LysE family transporter n=1 Tax=Micromonospora zhanjiangensis TaxID=1522057 RepID=A0ABV8KJF4_9ACTN
MTAAVLAGLVAGYGVAIPVGAIAALVLGLSARHSFRVGAAAALGVATADGLYAAVAVLGGASLAALLAPAAGPLRLVAAGVLLAMAAYTVGGALRRHRAPTGATSAERAGLGRPGRAYAGLLGLTLLNPLTVVYFAALVVGRQGAGRFTPATAVAFVLGAFAASASWQLLIAGGGSLVGRLLAGPRGRLATALVSATLIAVLAVDLLR